MNNKLMMTSASTVALIAGGAQQGLAQDGAFPAGYTLNVQGAYGSLNNPYVDKYSGAPDEFEEKIGDSNSDAGYLASLSLGRQLAPGKDMSFGLTLGGVPDNDITVTDGSDTFVRSNDFSFAALDFEMGRSLPMQGADVRLFYGARALYSNSEQEKLGREDVSGGYEASYKTESEYLGVGPRVGIGFATNPTPLGATGQIGFSGELGASVLFGERKDTFSYEASESGFSSGFSSGFTESKTAASLDAQLGVDYYFSPATKVSVGYQLQQLWNIDVTSDEDGESDLGYEDTSPRLIHGAFVGFTTTF
ncbi:Lpg1974 family pore-forming outer membrane protein [Yoonia sp. I 8.24]|uniref:Lpg1974 family pore-forming outer membrane protein n=1 Tax=Yoonia sp. I 8.24 TaxID=1537229 RepID=UPI001EE080CC|nr:Lpg1974 family pore-forming outer membrane protein [Yoonia sp. I 8.24]MCG3267364.1 hypothetical protein [Yoonia sp. I 8.24]